MIFRVLIDKEGLEGGEVGVSYEVIFRVLTDYERLERGGGGQAKIRWTCFGRARMLSTSAWMYVAICPPRVLSHTKR